MKTYVMEIKVTAKSSISHNGGEINGITAQLRREKFVDEKGSVFEIPVISGNSIRGKMRDIYAFDVLTKENGDRLKLSADDFNLMFSGGSLESTGSKLIDIEKVKKLRADLPGLSIFGCSVGNVILPGKLQIGKMLPICKESEHLIPDNFKDGVEIKSIWDLCQREMYTRKDDQKDENLNVFLSDEAKEGEKAIVQMQYYIETIAAGTVFYWKVCLTDTNDIETGAFLDILQKFSDTPYVLGGNGRIGFGDIGIEIIFTKTVNSDLELDDDFVKYVSTYNDNKKDVSGYFNKNIVEDNLLG